MAAHGARRLMEMARNLAHIIGIELVVAAQGIDLRKAGFGLEKLKCSGATTGLKTSPALERVMSVVRNQIATLNDDRILAGDLSAAAGLIASGAVTTAAGHHLLPGLGDGVA